MIASDRWEQGSFFHWISAEAQIPVEHLWGHAPLFCGSGRDGFRVLIKHGIEKRGWKRLYVPCYYCQEVVESLISTGIDVRLYPDGPEDLHPDLSSVALEVGDVVLRVDFFGLRSSLKTKLPAGVESIDDFSHDPWSESAWNSDADWCLVSLRKTLPVPDGGVVWSPKDRELPEHPSVTAEHSLTSLQRFAAMTIKTDYLSGKAISKDMFRELAAASEAKISRGELSGMTEWSRNILRCFPVHSWRQQRKRNFSAFAEAVSGSPHFKVMQPDDAGLSCPFSAILRFEDKDLRDYVRDALARLDIYPTTLWPLNKPAVQGITQRYLDFSNRMLSIQCDGRYSCEEMRRVAETILQIGNKYQSNAGSVYSAK